MELAAAADGGLDAELAGEDDQALRQALREDLEELSRRAVCVLDLHPLVEDEAHQRGLLQEPVGREGAAWGCCHRRPSAPERKAAPVHLPGVYERLPGRLPARRGLSPP